MKDITGIVLDGRMIVGTYDFHGAEDCYGKRILHNLRMNHFYFDVASRKTDRKLQFMYVQNYAKTNNNYQLIDDLGRGTIECRNFYVSSDHVVCAEAVFYKSSDKLTN